LNTLGNWSIHTKEFASSKLSGYFSLLDPQDIVNAEQEILDIVEEERSFAGVHGYSQEATLAAQTILRHFQQYPYATPQGKPIIFAIFLNASTPARVFRQAEKVTELSAQGLPAEEVHLYGLMRAD
jgi:hypothetical protein